MKKGRNKKGLGAVSLQTARNLIEELACCCGPERISLGKAGGRVCGEDIAAVSDCPSLDSSLKDGFALQAQDLEHTSSAWPIRLELAGTLTAGQQSGGILESGQAIRIMTGAPIPQGADAVLASEFASQQGNFVFASAVVPQGSNILFKGKDVRAQEIIVKSGTVLSPAHLGLLAAGGIAELVVYQQPRVMVVATGSELVAPGDLITPGKVAASNLVTLIEELKILGIDAEQMIIDDDPACLQEVMKPLIGQYDLVLTCGGVLDGDKDFTMQVMERIGVKPIFHRVRVNPGRGVCFGRKDKTFFLNLPGGPPSNHVSFLLFARLIVWRLSGRANQSLYFASLTKTIISSHGNWTQIYYGRLGIDMNRPEMTTVTPVFNRSRLMAMAEANCLILISEDQAELQTGTVIELLKFRD